MAMNRTGHHNASLFVGTEVEHSPAYGQKTLFVVGIQPQELIEASVIVHKCTHTFTSVPIKVFPKLIPIAQNGLVGKT
jgi:hypothetical protein